MFYKNTEGGIVESKNYGENISYTFPEGASVNLAGASIDISNLKIECYGGLFDNKSMEYLANMASKIPSCRPNILNTDIFIKDNLFVMGGYPPKEVFAKHGKSYVSPNTFKALSAEASKLPLHHPKVQQQQAIVRFILNFIETNKKELKSKIDALVNQNSIFPKYLSILYDDRASKHTSHIILEFRSKTDCTLRIENTSSILAALGEGAKKFFEEKFNIDFDAVEENFSDENTNILKLRNRENSAVEEIECPMPFKIKETVFNNRYKSMYLLLKGIGLPINNVHIVQSKNNQKLTQECVPFAIQNKIHFIEQRECKNAEYLLQKTARFRAEQAVLAYLMSGETAIPHFDNQTRADLGLDLYQENQWYPGYEMVCNSLDERISRLSLDDLRALHASIDLDGCFSLPPAFRPLLEESIRSKINWSDYIPVRIGMNPEDGQSLESNLIPSLVYSKSIHTLFATKEYLLQVDKDNMNLTLNSYSGKNLS